MKLLHRILMVLATVFAAAAPARADVILSELCDPHANYPTDRFIEIFNTGGTAVDLTGWQVVAVANDLEVCTWTLSGSLNSGEAKVCGGPSTVAVFTVHFPSAVWATTAGYMNWNGKIGDGARLRNPSNTVVDQVVATGILFENATLVRNSSVTVANPVFTVSEWTSTPKTLATDATPGSHNGSVPPAGGPVIAAIATDPSSPGIDAPVHVSATVTDTAGAVVAVTLSWGTSAGSQPNVIGMPLLSGDTYRTSSQIPGQPGGATVYFRVNAEGVAANSQSSLQSYVIAGGGGGAPTVLAVGEMSDSTLLVHFSEPVDETTAEVPGHYTVGALLAVAAVRDPALTSQVLITVRNLTAGTRTLSVSGVADLSANVAFGATRNFNYVDVSIPAGYYDSAIGLAGSALRVALHNIIKGHTVRSYDFAITAFQTTDVKPNGKIWDVYSDIPGGTPPYEYSFGPPGQGATEGSGYNREHTWPQAWFSGNDPYSDLHMLYPTDAKVNNYRGSFPFGNVGTATTTSLNGSKVGPSATAGYGGTVFEPIDPFKGDLARAHFYVTARYFGQDGSWPGSASADGVEFEPWALAQYLTWSANDPVSWKERMRNGAVYLHQNNRSPFVDHPEFLAMIWDSTSFVNVGGAPVAASLQLANAPNPFTARTTMTFDLPGPEQVTLRVFDVSGRRQRTLADREFAAGRHRVEWDGRDDSGAALEPGLYFASLQSVTGRVTRRVVLAK